MFTFQGKGRWRRPVIGCALPQERHFHICRFLGKHTLENPVDTAATIR
jgi:hypothetical protein